MKNLHRQCELKIRNETQEYHISIHILTQNKIFIEIIFLILFQLTQEHALK